MTTDATDKEQMADVLQAMQSELGGFGKQRAENIESTLSPTEFAEGLVDAYLHGDTDVLQRVPGIGRGYALKLARWYARREGWADGEGESHEVDAVRFEDLTNGGGSE